MTQGVLPHEVEDEELKVYPILQEAFWESSEEDHCLSDPVLLSVIPFPFFLLQEESSQTEEGPSISPVLEWLQNITQVKAQFKWELAHEWEELAMKYEDWQTRKATKHRDQWAMMATKHEDQQTMMIA